MSPDDQATIDAVTAKLTARLYIGARVETHSGKRGTVVDLRDNARWARVKHDPTGWHGEYDSRFLRLI